MECSRGFYLFEKETALENVEGRFSYGLFQKKSKAICFKIRACWDPKWHHGKIIIETICRGQQQRCRNCQALALKPELLPAPRADFNLDRKLIMVAAPEIFCCLRWKLEEIRLFLHLHADVVEPWGGKICFEKGRNNTFLQGILCLVGMTSVVF